MLILIVIVIIIIIIYNYYFCYYHCYYHPDQLWVDNRVFPSLYCIPQYEDPSFSLVKWETSTLPILTT